MDVDGLQQPQWSDEHVVSLLAFLIWRIVFHDVPVVSDGHHGDARVCSLGRAHESLAL